MKRKIFKEDILEAGKELMFLNGYNATAIKDITDKVEIPKGSFYNHFKSKEEFTLEMLMDYTQGGINNFTSTLQEKGKPSRDKILNLFESMITFTKNRGEFNLGCLMSNFSAEMSDVNENFRNLLEERFVIMEGLVEECIKEGHADKSISKDINASVTAGFIVSSWHGALVRMKTSSSATPLENFHTILNNVI